LLTADTFVGGDAFDIRWRISAGGEEFTVTESLALNPSTRQDATRVMESPSVKRVFALANKGRYRRPEVATYPIDGLKISGPVSMAGNTGF
jgi:hypothetical protein